MRAAIYIRRSVKKDDEGGSLEDQEKDCRAYCEKEGWAVVGVWRDEMKGTTNKRPGLEALRKEQDTYDVVVVWTLARLGRSLTNTVQLLDELPGVVAVKDGLSTVDETSGGYLLSRIMAVFADYFIRQHRDAVEASQVRQIEHNRWPGGPPPFGLTTDNEHRLIIEPTEAAALRRAAELVTELRGATGDVARKLDKEGHRRTGGKTWSSRTQEVRRLLREDHLTGTATWKGETIEAPVVIDPATLTEARHYLNGTQQAARRTNQDFWLSGLVSCPCGGHYVGRGHGRYICNGDPCTHHVHGWRQPAKDKLEEQVWTNLVGLFRHAASDGWDALGSDAPYAPEPAQAGGNRPALDLEPIRGRLQALEEVVVKARADLRQGLEQPEVVAELERRRDAAQAELHSAEATNIEATKADRYWVEREDLAKEVDRLEQITEPDERRAVLERAGLRVVLYDQPLRFAGDWYYWRWELEEK